MTSRDDSFDFVLPLELIAQRPAADRPASRLLLVERGVGVAGEARFSDLDRLLRPGDLLVVNDSRVLPARLHLVRVPGGGKVELLLVRPCGCGEWIVMARPGRRLRPGSLLAVPGEGPSVEIHDRLDAGYFRVGALAGDLADLAERCGETPLPPYIRRDAEHVDPRLADMDRERYQTVYARDKGSVAAPTAGLHFDSGLLQRLGDNGVGLARVTLHVGPGTFRPPVAEDLRRGRLHAEVFRFPAAVDRALSETRAAGGRVIAVGTTALRVLETVRRLDLDDDGPDLRRWEETPDDPDPEFTGVARREDGAWDIAGMTRLFVRPPQIVPAVDGLLTNFHLPGSSLLMLISAFAGPGVWPGVYAHAVAERFRFYSYGDAMFIRPSDSDGALAGEDRS